MTGETNRQATGTAEGAGLESEGGMTRRAAVLAGVALTAAAGTAAAQAPQSERRGSQKLVEALGGMKGGISRANINDLLKILDRENIRLVDWRVLGIPNPEVVTGTVQTSPKLAGELVGRVYAANLRASIRNFPHGIPPVIDSVQVEIELKG